MRDAVDLRAQIQAVEQLLAGREMGPAGLLLECASSYLTKPIDIREFFDCVDEEVGCLR